MHFTNGTLQTCSCIKTFFKKLWQQMKYVSAHILSITVNWLRYMLTQNQHLLAFYYKRLLQNILVSHYECLHTIFPPDIHTSFYLSVCKYRLYWRFYRKLNWHDCICTCTKTTFMRWHDYCRYAKTVGHAVKTVHINTIYKLLSTHKMHMQNDQVTTEIYKQI